MGIEDLISALEMAEINLKEAESDYDSVVKERDELRQQLEAIKQSSKRRAPCENLCEARAFEIEIRQLKAQIDKLSNHQKGDL